MELRGRGGSKSWGGIIISLQTLFVTEVSPRFSGGQRSERRRRPRSSVLQMDSVIKGVVQHSDHQGVGVTL